ncbi:MAG: DeoR/GlpR transcriptional regulator [Firmicutes bacterium]|nr:DeoR/GlpR transcriptional regulator [Bacillota bacterium]
MLPEERRQYILAILATNGAATVRDLAERFDVSLVTIRRDLERLEGDGLIIKAHGGAVSLGLNTHAELRLTEREQQYRNEKDRIGVKAASLVQPGDTVILDEGSTCLAIARYLRAKDNITIITNGIRVAAELLGGPGITLLVIGGLCNHESAMLYGADAERAYSRLRADTYFMGIDAFSAEHGIMDGNFLQVNLKQTKASASSQVIGVAHQAKFDRRAVARVGPLTMLHALITDGPVDQDLRQCLDTHNIRCIEA